jgi:hypothetical protein
VGLLTRVRRTVALMLMPSHKHPTTRTRLSIFSRFILYNYACSPMNVKKFPHDLTDQL